MIFRVIQDGLEVWTPAKVNWTLKILGQRSDGFHEIESVQAAISLWDTLRLRMAGAGGGVCLRVHEASCWPPPGGRVAGEEALPADERNLVVRALRLLERAAGISLAADVELIKRIPRQAGLGGGSSNAAATLLAGNRLWKLSLPGRQLAELAAELGSDVPFFLGSSPAICCGRGERLVPLRVPLRLDIVVVHPPFGLGTAEVYNRYREEAVRGEGRESVAGGDWQAGGTWDRWRLVRQWVNDLQPVAERMTPWIGRLERAFARLNVLAHQMSGSGTAYFGICRHAAQAVQVAHRLRGWRLGRVFVATNTPGTLSA